MQYIASTQISVQYIPLTSYRSKDSYEYANEGEEYTYHYVTNRASSLEEIIENAMGYYMGQDRECLLESGYRPSIDEEDDYARIEFSFLSDAEGNSLNKDQIALLQSNSLKGWITVVEFEVFLKEDLQDEKQLTADDYRTSGIRNLDD